MVYANQNHSREFSNRKKMIVCASVFEIMCPGPVRDQNNVPHTAKLLVYIHIMFSHLFANSIKMVNWLLDYNLREQGKLKVSNDLQSDCLFVLRFYGPVNPMGSCRARSVYLTTRLLGRLSPLSG